MAVAEVPWEGDTLLSWEEADGNAAPMVPLQGGEWVPWPSRSPSGWQGLVLRLDRKMNEFHYGIAIFFPRVREPEINLLTRL